MDPGVRWDDGESAGLQNAMANQNSALPGARG